MSSEDGYLGCPCGFDNLRALNDKLNAKVVEQVNTTQELVMLNNFAHETNEYHIKNSLHERISDILSWRWVLEDLTKRVEEAISTLRYEHKALRVVVQRLQDEIGVQSQEASRPGALSPLSDSVEESIMEEYNFLRDQKKKFEKMIPELENQTAALEKTKKKIEADILNKKQALSVDEACAGMSFKSSRVEGLKRKNKRGSTISRWENRCKSLKRAGLRALSNAVITRQKVRGARVYLSITAQAYGARVDSALRRRLHANKIKLQDLNWQKEEAMRDYKSLEEEVVTTEQNILETMEQERKVEVRLADRTFRPSREMTKDEVNEKLKVELERLRIFSKQLKNNLERITTLQDHLRDAIIRVNCCAEDIAQVVRLDEERIQARLGEVTECTWEHRTPSGPPNVSGKTSASHFHSDSVIPLTAIKEEDEDDYPFDY